MNTEDNIQGCIGIAVILLVCAGIVVSCAGWLGGGFHYSDGYREGHIQKISHKGIIWVTCEGEMALPGLRTRGSGENQSIGNTWEFTVLNPHIATILEDVHEDELVRLHYEQYIFSPPWKGSSQYRIVGADKLKHVDTSKFK